jgi:hypothetical protein
MVTVYVPFAAVGVLAGGDEVEVPPPQPDTVRPITTRTQAASMTARPQERRPANQNKSSPAVAMMICMA